MDAARNEAVRIPTQLMTQASHFKLIAGLLREHQFHELPEIVAVRIARGSQDYLDWIAKATSPDAREEINR